MKKVFAMLALSSLLLAACGDTESTATVTKDEYKKLESKEGKEITYDQVKEIVGGSAKKVEKFSNTDKEYIFDGKGGVDKNSTVKVGFMGGELAYVIEDGLLTKKKKLTKAEEDAIQAQNDAAAAESEITDVLHQVFGEKTTYNKQDTVQQVQYSPDSNTVNIKVYAQDGLSNKGIKEGVWMDISKVLRQLKDKGYGTVSFDIQYPLTDKYGNKSDGTVMSVSFNQDTLQKINWNNFDYKNIPNVATTYWQHQGF